MTHENTLDDSLRCLQVDCHEVVFFWRLKRMIDITSNALRQQISNIEGSSSPPPPALVSIGSAFASLLARRLEREVKEILDDFSSDESLKETLLKGKRVNIAEELSKPLFDPYAQ